MSWFIDVILLLLLHDYYKFIFLFHKLTQRLRSFPGWVFIGLYYDRAQTRQTYVQSNYGRILHIIERYNTERNYNSR